MNPNSDIYRFASGRTLAILGLIILLFSMPASVLASGDSRPTDSFAVQPVTEPPPAAGGVRFEGILSVDYKTHFVSYGRDIWGAGSSWSDDQAGTINPWLNLTVATDLVQVYAGAWMDINDNSDAAEIGSKIQEYDLWAGFTLTPGRFRTGMTYAEYFFLDQSDSVIDFWVAYADYGQFFSRFGFNPTAKLHVRDFGDAIGTKKAILVGANPWLTLTPAMRYPFSLSLPVETVYFEKGFHGGDEGLGYWSIGSILYVPLTQNPDAVLNWSANIGLTWYLTDQEVIPTNPDENFVRGSIGLTVNF